LLGSLEDLLLLKHLQATALGLNLRAIDFSPSPEARGSLKPGIYRAKGRGELQQLFSYLDSVPTVPSIWNFEEFAERESLPILERILPQFIEEALK